MLTKSFNLVKNVYIKVGQNNSKYSNIGTIRDIRFIVVNLLEGHWWTIIKKFIFLQNTSQLLLSCLISSRWKNHLMRLWEMTNIISERWNHTNVRTINSSTYLKNRRRLKQKYFELNLESNWSVGQSPTKIS